jgi:hypothetical protein
VGLEDVLECTMNLCLDIVDPKNTLSSKIPIALLTRYSCSLKTAKSVIKYAIPFYVSVKLLSRMRHHHKECWQTTLQEKALG